MNQTKRRGLGEEAEGTKRRERRSVLQRLQWGGPGELPPSDAKSRVCVKDAESGESNRVRPNLDPVLTLLRVVWLRRHDARPREAPPALRALHGACVERARAGVSSFPSLTLALGDNLNFDLK